MNSKILYLRLLHYLIPYWHIFALAIVAIITMAITDPALAALIRPLLDGGFVAKDPHTIQLIPLLLMALVTIKGIALWISSVGMTWVASRLVMDLRLAMFSKILTLPTVEFDNTSTGVLLSKVSYDVSRVMAAATESLITLVRDSLAVMGLLAWMFYLNWRLSFIIFFTVPFIVIVVRVVSKKLRGINLSIQEGMGEITRILEEAITGHKLVKVFGGQQYEQTRFTMACEAVRKLEVHIQTASGLSVFLVQMCTAIGLAIIIYIASLQSAADSITVGGFVSLFTAMGMLFAPVKRLTKINEQLQQGLAAAQSIFGLIDKPSEPEIMSTEAVETEVENEVEEGIKIDSTARKMVSVEHPPKNKFIGHLSFEQVQLIYPGHSQPALTEINLTIQPGETIALVGRSGSGKTTLVNLIPRFYPMTQGRLQIDQIDLQRLPLVTLRANIALVSQEIVLFNDTVAANIAYGTMAGVSKDRILAAAQAANALEFIEQLPAGFDTMVGERGVKLSGGQRQRLAIARALLKEAPILIFDEATSALDTQAESQVQQSLERLKSGRTTLIIAHRLSTVAKADRIVVMEQGRIVEEGTHLELLERGGMYANLYLNTLN